MIVTVKIDDDIGLTYQEEAGERHLDLQTVLADRLHRAGDLDPRARYLIVTGRTREQLETRLGGMPVVDAQDLLSKVTRMARIGIGDCELTLTPGQLEELTRLAHKQSKTVSRMLSEMWATFTSEFFTRIPHQK
ncbi:MAG TPA: hypothetical protein VFO16_09345 [Pseudonocardiaceae bacterium]|nr:hypothetical protein [Pseudonocardiaceae bacterium]